MTDSDRPGPPDAAADRPMTQLHPDFPGRPAPTERKPVVPAGKAPRALTLDPEAVLETATLLRKRIRERFPGTGLGNVAEEVVAVTRDAMDTVRRISRPNLPLRLGVGLVLALMLVAVALPLWFFRLAAHDPDVLEFVQVFEALVGSVVFLGAAAAYLLTLENRIRRRRALRAIYRLRALAHVIDMHQLTKAPERLFRNREPGRSTSHSPKLDLTPFLLGRYLDYCTELLALLGKIAAIYSARLSDAPTLEAVDQIEDLTANLSGRIWQKVEQLDRLSRQHGE